MKRILLIVATLIGSLAPAAPAGAHTANCHGHWSIFDYFYADTGWAGTTSALGHYTQVYVQPGSIAVVPNQPRLISSNWLFLDNPSSQIEPFVGVSAFGDYGMHISSDEWVQYEYWPGADQWFNFGSAAEGVWHSIETWRTGYANGYANFTTRIDGYPVRYIVNMPGQYVIDVAQGLEYTEARPVNSNGDNYEAIVGSQKYMSIFGVWVNGYPGGTDPSCVYAGHGLFGSWGLGVFSHGK